MSDKIPMCWKCASAMKTLTKGQGAFELTGCTECDDIKNFADAQKLCPLIDNSSKKVVIAVVDGECSIVEKPDNIAVEVRDYVDGVDEETDGYHTDKDGDTYRVFSFPAKKIKFSANGDNAFTDVELKFHNYYECPNCGHEWEDEWDCMVDDECGECGCSDISPYKSDDI